MASTVAHYLFFVDIFPCAAQSVFFIKFVALFLVSNFCTTVFLVFVQGRLQVKILQFFWRFFFWQDRFLVFLQGRLQVKILQFYWRTFFPGVPRRVFSM